MRRGQGGYYEPLLVPAPVLLGKDLPQEFWWLRSSSFGGSTSRHQEKWWVYTDYYCFIMTSEINKRKERKQKLEMEQSISTINAASNNPLVTNLPKVNGYALQPGCALSWRLNHDKPHWSKPVTGSGVSCRLCQRASGKKVISQIQNCILFNFNLFVKHSAIFHTSQTLGKYKQTIASSEKDCPSKVKNVNNQNWKGKNKKYGQTYVWCCNSAVGGGSCGD